MAKATCPRCHCKMMWNPFKQSTSYCGNCGYNLQKQTQVSWHPPVSACEFPTI